MEPVNIIALTDDQLSHLLEQAAQKGAELALNQTNNDPLADYGPHITTRELAKIKGVSVHTIRSWMHDRINNIPQPTRVGKSYYWTQAQVREWIG